MKERVELYVVRHAAALPTAATGDHARTLSTTGQVQAAQLGKELAAVKFDVVLASNATRAQQTLAAIATAHAQVLPPALSAAHFYEASVQTWLDAVAELPHDVTCVLLIGHNPTLATLVGELLGEYVGMSPGDCIKLVGTAGWSGVMLGEMTRI